MTIKEELKNVVYPILKFLPIIVALVILSMVVVKRVINITPVTYESKGSIKINTKSQSKTEFELFSLGGSISTGKNLVTETEILKSPKLIRQTLDKLNWSLGIFRRGRYLTIELDDERPFEIDYTVKDSSCMNQPFDIEYLGQENFKVLSNDQIFTWNEMVSLPTLDFTVRPNHAYNIKKPESLVTGDIFQFIIRTPSYLAQDINPDNLFFKHLDKDVPILKIYFEHPLPEKSRDFINTLMTTYIENDKAEQEKFIDKTLAYINGELLDAKNALSSSENALANYRENQEFIDPKLEVDYSFKEILSTQKQKVDIELQIAELTEFYKYLVIDQNSMSDFAPNFKALKDQLFHSSFLNVQALESQKKDLLRKFVSTSEEVEAVNLKIEDLRAFLDQTVVEKLRYLRIQLEKLNLKLEKEEDKIHSFPTKQKDLNRLERRIVFYQDLYNYLLRKKTELTISRNSDFHPHEIIEYASTPEHPSSPNKPLLYGLGVFLAILLGIILAFVYGYFNTRIFSREEVARQVNANLLGHVNHIRKKASITGAADNLATNLLRGHLQNETRQPGIVSLSSFMPNEGKTFITKQLAYTLVNRSLRVLLVDTDLIKQDLSQTVPNKATQGLLEVLTGTVTLDDAIASTDHPHLDILTAAHTDVTVDDIPPINGDFINALVALKNQYDFIVVDNAPVSLSSYTIPILETCTMNLFVLRRNKTRKRDIRRINEYINEWKLPNLMTVFNSASVPRRRLKYGYKKRNKFKIKFRIWSA